MPASSATCPVNANIPAPIITPVPIETVPVNDRLPALYSFFILSSFCTAPVGVLIYPRPNGSPDLEKWPRKVSSPTLRAHSDLFPVHGLHRFAHDGHAISDFNDTGYTLGSNACRATLVLGIDIAPDIDDPVGNQNVDE